MRVALGLAAFALLGVVSATASASAGIIVTGSTLLSGPWIVIGQPHSPSMARVAVFVVAALATGLAILRRRVILSWLADDCTPLSGRAVVALVVEVVVVMAAVAVLVALGMPGTMRGSWWPPWDLAGMVGLLVVEALAGAWRPLVVIGLAGPAAVAILVASVWLSRIVASDRPG